MYSRARKALWRLALYVVVLWSACAPLLGQSAQPFSKLDDSLILAADTLLVSPAQMTAPATAMASPDDTPSAALAIRVDRRPHLWLDSGLAPAAARLDLLRPAIEPILRNHGVPTELAAIILVESSGRPMAISPKGARGLWQLMPDTARRYGLLVDGIQDDRINLFKATDAAARYLHDLYAQFGDWKLALAAYNAGERNVGSAMLRAHTQDFDQLTNLRILPTETMNYVPRVLAAAQTIVPFSTLGAVHRPASAITVFAVSTP